MAIVLMGASCTGKTSIANELKKLDDFRVYSGKDYLRLARNEDEAWDEFINVLSDADRKIIYILHDIEKFNKIKNLKNVYFYKIESDLSTMKERFLTRIYSDDLPSIFEDMLQNDYDDWKKISSECSFVNVGEDSACKIAADIFALYQDR